ncbi:metallophosphoesterase family protein [Ammonifex thiophilus]|uniref:Phosphoesterase n=1 Tax=Ammonifex thiophilus TaxID=444093 RepID=A0A3D8P3E1_9THEO|nr:YfcE family phosphodiesterase [Ammonifex thiophilus]RDV81148.1 YfcE family phosphodiesterase [Ammonifex thiophilus]
MRLGLVSDSHGELENLREALRQLKEKWQVEMVAHLGDAWEDTVVFEEFPTLRCLRVPGVYCPPYRDPAVPNRLVEEIAGYRLLFTHTPSVHPHDLEGDPNPQLLAQTESVDIIAFGHTHVPEIRREGKVLWVNPGHLKSRDKKGHSPSYAVVELEEKAVRVWLVDLLSGVPFAEETFRRED